jgi:L-alanine-DL-glutamate epimerase-like enolase superfamily enzyme
MRISSIEVNHYQIPLPEPLFDSMHGEMTHFAVVTTTVRGDGGEEGVGYTYTVGKTGGYAVQALLEHDVLPMLLGEDPRHIERIWKKMWWHMHYVGRGGLVTFAMAAIDIALWDMKAKQAGEPLWTVLGGHDPQVLAYSGGIDLHMSPEQLQEQTRKNLDNGFRAIKIKVGRPRLSDDLDCVKAVREIVGPDLPLMVDANMKWTVDQAIRASHKLADFDVYWLEEPTIPDDVSGHGRILREGSLPIATGENLHTVYEFQKMLSAQAVSFPEPDASNLGGITPWLKVAHMAEAFNLPVTTHGIHELHVHLLAAIPNASYLEAHGFGLDDYISHPVAVVDGFATAPDRTGHGVDFEWEALEPLRAPELAGTLV